MSHSAKLVREGNSLKCEHCGAHVMTFIEPPADGREELAEALAEPMAADPFGQTLIGDTSWIPRTPAGGSGGEETSGQPG